MSSGYTDSMAMLASGARSPLAQGHVGGRNSDWLDAYGQNEQMNWSDYYDAYRKHFGEQNQPTGYKKPDGSSTVQNQYLGNMYQRMLDEQNKAHQGQMDQYNQWMQSWQQQQQQQQQQMQQQMQQPTAGRPGYGEMTTGQPGVSSEFDRHVYMGEHGPAMGKLWVRGDDGEQLARYLAMNASLGDSLSRDGINYRASRLFEGGDGTPMVWSLDHQWLADQGVKDEDLGINVAPRWTPGATEPLYSNPNYYSGASAPAAQALPQSNFNEQDYINWKTQRQPDYLSNIASSGMSHYDNYLKWGQQGGYQPTQAAAQTTTRAAAPAQQPQQQQPRQTTSWGSTQPTQWRF